MITAAIDSGEGTLSATFTSLDGTAADVDTRLGEALTQFRDALAQRAGEAAGRAQEPLTSLDGRMDRAMQEAEEATHRSWWENALRAIPWRTIAGIVVGLVVTIAVVALLGTGIGALIVAGALAGALSVAATTLIDNRIAGRETNWGELGKQMLIGAAFGAIGGALGGGVTGALVRPSSVSSSPESPRWPSAKRPTSSPALRSGSCRTLRPATPGTRA